MYRSLAIAGWSLAGLAAFGCGGGHDDVMSPSDAGGPNLAQLMSVSPTGGAAGVAVSASVVMHFGAAMGFGMEEYVDLHQGNLAGPVVPMSCAWSTDRETLTCAPSQPLAHRTTYWIHLGGDLMTETGEAIDYDAYGPMMGGEWIQGGMMGGSHAGSPWGMMGGDWRSPNGAYGMAFPFTTA